jgi:hypothetical protein
MTTTVSTARVFDTVRMSAPGALDGVLRLEFFNVLKEFLSRTDAWRDAIELFIMPGEPDYPIEATVPSKVLRLVFLEGVRPAPTLQTPHQLGPQRLGHLRIDPSGIMVLHVPIVPGNPEVWHAHLSLGLSDPVTNEGLPHIPDDIVDRYQDAIVSGLLSKVLMHPNKPYSNKELATFHGRKYNAGVARARNEVRSGFIAGGQHWRFPQTFANRMGQRLW